VRGQFSVQNMAMCARPAARLREADQARFGNGAIWDRMQHESLPGPVTTAPAVIKLVQPLGDHGSIRPRLVSVLVSFTPVRHRSPAATRIVFAQFTDGGGH
jgi:hypothetical protein